MKNIYKARKPFVILFLLFLLVSFALPLLLIITGKAEIIKDAEVIPLLVEKVNHHDFAKRIYEEFELKNKEPRLQSNMNIYMLTYPSNKDEAVIFAFKRRNGEYRLSSISEGQIAHQTVIWNAP